MFEFGSRYGEDTVEFAKKYPNAIIYGFECNTETLPVCRENISKFSNITLTEKAVADIDGKLSFWAIDKDKTETTWEDGNPGASSLLKASGKYKIENYVQKEMIVEAITLNTFMVQNDIAFIDILWMDIQGAELKALVGLKDKIETVKIMHIEVEFIEIYTQQPLFKDIKKYLAANGFVFMGFTSKCEYFADAVFVNNRIYKMKHKSRLRVRSRGREVRC